jgi:hypothetical protein
LLHVRLASVLAELQSPVITPPALMPLLMRMGISMVGDVPAPGSGCAGGKSIAVRQGPSLPTMTPPALMLVLMRMGIFTVGMCRRRVLVAPAGSRSPSVRARRCRLR